MTLPSHSLLSRQTHSRRLVYIVIATRAAKLPSPETRTGNAERSQTLRLAVGAASVLVFADFQLNVVWAPATSLKFAALLVNLIRFVVVAPQPDQALEAHLEGFLGLRQFQSLGISKGVAQTHTLVDNRIIPNQGLQGILASTVPGAHDRPSYPGSSQASQKRSVEMVEGLFILWQSATQSDWWEEKAIVRDDCDEEFENLSVKTRVTKEAGRVRVLMEAQAKFCILGWGTFG